MKMKKILSMGALALVIASSTSVASFAAETSNASNTSKFSLTDEERDIVVAMAKEYKHGGNFLGIDKKTTTSSAVGIDAGAIEKKLGNYESGKRLLNHLDLNGNVNDNAHSVVEAIINRCKAASDPEDEFTKFKNEILNVKDKIMEKDKAVGEDRANKEKELKELLANNEYKVTLGKNSDGATTVSFESKVEGIIALQVSAQDVEHIADALNKLNLEDLEKINAGKNILDNN